MEPVQHAAGSEDGAASAAVVAHKLLGAARLVVEAVEMLERKWPLLGERDRDGILALVRRQGVQLQQGLETLVHGVLPDPFAAAHGNGDGSADGQRRSGDGA
jgi:hypothetical protein